MSDDNERDGDAERLGAINAIAADAIEPVAKLLSAEIWDKLHDSFATALMRSDVALREKDAEIERLKQALADKERETIERCAKLCDGAVEEFTKSIDAMGRNAYDVGGRQTSKSLADAIRSFSRDVSK